MNQMLPTDPDEPTRPEPASTPAPRERGINRIICGVWDLDAAMEFYGQLLGVTFQHGHGEEAESFGVRVAFSWEGGMELVSPLPDRDSHIRTHLETAGEGIIGVVFAVADADRARDAAAGLGMPTYYSLDYDQATINERLGGRWSTYKQHFITPVAPLDGTVLLGEFAPVDATK